MSKQGQIDAFETFCKAVLKDKKEDPPGCYFEDLVAHRMLIIKNIKDDIMPLVGIYITQGECDTHVAQIRSILTEANREIGTLRAQLLASREYDVRELNRRRKEIEDEEKRLKDEADEIDAKLQENL